MAGNAKTDLEKITKELFPNLPPPKQVAEFFEAVGRAISAWGLVEEALYLLFEKATAPSRPGASGCAFHVLLFRSKLAATDAAVRFALLGVKAADKDRLVEEWEKLHKKAGKRAARRNHFAHFQVFTHFQEVTENRKVQLRPPMFDFRYAAQLMEGTTYTVTDIRDNAESFREMAKKLRSFLPKIPPPK